ncbi:hypothetical protein AAMO2058_001230400 [Amorphochlora amoebiformis]
MATQRGSLSVDVQVAGLELGNRGSIVEAKVDNISEIAPISEYDAKAKPDMHRNSSVVLQAFHMTEKFCQTAFTFLLDTNKDGHVDYSEILGAPLRCFRCLEFVVGTGYKSIPIGALFGAILVIFALEFNVQEHPNMDFLIVAHGIIVSFYSLENDLCGNGEARCCSKGRNNCILKCISCFECCMRAGFQVWLALIGTLLLWSTILIFTGEIVSGVLLTAIFTGIEKSCDLAIPVARTRINATSDSLLQWYSESGMQAGVNALSGDPFKMGISGQVQNTVNKIASQATSYVDAIKSLCDLFNGLSWHSTLVSAGAFVALIAQIIVLVYHVNYFTVWWYENKRAQESVKRHLDDDEPHYQHTAIKKTLDENFSSSQRKRVLKRLDAVTTTHDRKKAHIKRTMKSSDDAFGIEKAVVVGEVISPVEAHAKAGHRHQNKSSSLVDPSLQLPNTVTL